jgi:hypothetical protein
LHIAGHNIAITINITNAHSLLLILFSIFLNTHKMVQINPHTESVLCDVELYHFLIFLR